MTIEPGDDREDKATASSTQDPRPKWVTPEFTALSVWSDTGGKLTHSLDATSTHPLAS